MSRVVMKFGGASLVSIEAIRQASHLIKEKLSYYSEIVVVASAMGQKTDELINLAHSLGPNPPKREQDMLISAGERISTALLAIALSHEGVEAISLTGSQAGVITSSDHSNALIHDVRPVRIPPLLSSGTVVIVAGFQGVSGTKDITTLGRGGSDTTAVALGVALNADKVEFYKDVDGCYTSDPHIDEEATLIPHLSYDEALKIYEKKKRSVIHPRAIRLAQLNHIPLQITSYRKENLAKNAKGSWIIENGLKRPERPVFEDELLCPH